MSEQKHREPDAWERYHTYMKGFRAGASVGSCPEIKNPELSKLFSEGWKAGRIAARAEDAKAADPKRKRKGKMAREYWIVILPGEAPFIYDLKNRAVALAMNYRGYQPEVFKVREVIKRRRGAK